MKLSLDVSAVPPKPAGAGRYIFELARQLARSDEVSPTYIARTDDRIRWENIGRGIDVQNLAPSQRPFRLAWEQLRLPGQLRQLGVDVHHAPHYTMPERAKVPVVVTIHDMTFFDNPQWHERSKVVLFRRAINVAVKQATKIIAVSHDTAHRLRERFGDIDVTVIPHGVDHTRFNTKVDANDKHDLQAIGIPDNYITFVGTIEPRKNVPLLVAAFDKIADTNKTLHLVIAGQRGWQLEDFDTALQSARHKDRIIETGYVSEPLVPKLLRNARAVAYPSHVEGFGLPALEALACGAPLITTKGSAVEEVVGDAATFVMADDRDELASALETAIHEDRQTARARGEAASQNFTWEATARAHIEVYKMAVS